MVQNMDTIVRVVCIGFIFVIAVVCFDNVKLLIESNEGKRYIKSLKMRKPKMAAKDLVKMPSFFVMVNHGPDLCNMEEPIMNIPYYKGKSYLLGLGDSNDKN